ncbi:MAG TPA: HD domain-containing phosphohydrolase, partial [Holophaga sp.]|nr:HD domain-containing phosphohydrolase [Holophaga sp.]
FDPAWWRGVEDALEQETRRQVSLILQSDEPSVLPKHAGEGLAGLAGLQYAAWDGRPARLLDDQDVACLSIRMGSLSEAERLEVESHVTHTFHFLQQIPWTRDLAAVPDIAYAHHERMNGSGYPRRLLDREIPVQSRAMAIADIFDALTAQDRPYKAAVSLDRSLAILESDAKAGHLDPELLHLFVEARVFERTVPPG